MVLSRPQYYGRVRGGVTESGRRVKVLLYVLLDPVHPFDYVYLPWVPVYTESNHFCFNSLMDGTIYQFASYL